MTEPTELYVHLEKMVLMFPQMPMMLWQRLRIAVTPGEYERLRNENGEPCQMIRNVPIIINEQPK